MQGLNGKWTKIPLAYTQQCDKGSRDKWSEKSCINKLLGFKCKVRMGLSFFKEQGMNTVSTNCGEEKSLFCHIAV